MTRVHVAPEFRQRRKYSRDLKERVIYQTFTLHKKPTEIAIDLDMSLRVVQRILTTWKEIGDVVREPKKMGRTPLMSQGQVEFMIALIESRPDIYLDEIAELLLWQHDVDVSLATVWKTLRALGYSSKRLSKRAAERNEEARNNYLLQIGKYPPEYLVFTDESAVNLLTTFRQMGWAPKGKRARKTTAFVRGKRYSMLPAISLSGLIFSHIKLGSFDGHSFVTALRELVSMMNPYPGPNSVLVMDNCAIHHVSEVEEICMERGVLLIYLPPYSPDMNPIEEAFSFVKSFIRRHGDEFRALCESSDKEQPILWLYHALNQVTIKATHGWFHHSKYI